MKMAPRTNGRMEFLKQWHNERNMALTKAVMHNDWKAVERFCSKWGIPVPENKEIMMAGIYQCAAKADLPAKVKDVAIEKCTRLGFDPYSLEKETMS